MERAHSNISVIMCAYTERRWDDMVAAIHAVQCQSVAPLEILLVIDHNLALAERARTAFPEVTVLENREARGLSGARNTGLAAARGEIIAFIDEDAVAAPDWLQHMSSGYDDPSVLGVGGAIEPWWPAERPSWFPDEFDWVVGCTYRGMPVATSPVRNLIGCNMSFRREVFTSVGGFRSGIGRIGTLPVGCEETELCIRARQRWPERSFLYDPRVRVRHRVTPERATWSYYWSRCYAEGLSKALVARFVGANDGLASERTYTLRVLPAGVFRAIAACVTRGDIAGLGRAAAIVAGLAITTFGYLRGSIRQRLRLPASPAIPENG
jgi:glycosyltransferase involved in cell wall biosynthesis